MVGELEKGVGLEKCYIAQLFQFNIGPLFPQTSGFVDGSILYSKSRPFRSCLGHLLIPKINGAMDCQMKQTEKMLHICNNSWIPVDKNGATWVLGPQKMLSGLRV